MAPATSWSKAGGPAAQLVGRLLYPWAQPGGSRASVRRDTPPTQDMTYEDLR